jgi:SAM-dependent methyltransferase
MPLRSALLWRLDRLFPPNPRAHFTPEQATEYELGKAAGTMGRYLAELASHEVEVLDFGCGWGGETIWLAERVSRVVGVDPDPRSIEQARAALARSGARNCAFECAPDGRLPWPDESFDAVFSTDTLEHVMDLDVAFAELWRVLRPGGVLLSRFGPLFCSPHGYHLYWACQVPYAHLVFGLPAILELRQARSGAPSGARTWQEMGLNRKRFREFKASAAQAGFELTRFAAIPVRGLTILTKLPALGDLFVFGVDCRLEKGSR